MRRPRMTIPGGITHGTVVWFLIGSLLGGMLFIQLYLLETPMLRLTELPQLPQLPEFTLPPTWNQAAYDAYLNGLDHARDGDHQRSVEQYTRALEEDPDFSIAWAALSEAHSAMYFEGTDPTEERLDMARNAVDRAFRLDADLPEAHLALAYYYYRGPRDFDRALEELAIAEPDFPEDTDLLRTRAFIYRSTGEWSAALFELERAAEMDPQNAALLEAQAHTHLARRDAVLAQPLLERALELAPENETARIELALIPLRRNGETGALHAAAVSSLGSGRPWMAWLAAFMDRDYGAALQALDDTASDTLVWQGGYLPKSLAYGLTQHAAGNVDVAQLHFGDAREVLEQDLQTDSDNPDLLIALGGTLAYLGAHESAIRLAHRVVEVPPVADDLFTAPRYRLDAARVLAAAGDPDAAIDELEIYLSSPGLFSVGGIVADPRFDPIREHPRFQALVDRQRL